jgi:hypothetical protein
LYSLRGFAAKSLCKSLQVTWGKKMPPTGLVGPYPNHELDGCLQMPVTDGIGHWVVVDDGVVEVVVDWQGMTVVVVVGGLPPCGGFFPKQSDLDQGFCWVQ